MSRLTRSDRQPVCRNVMVRGRRTSVRMEPLMWRCLDDVANRESLTVNQLCTLVDSRRGDAALTASLRVFLMGYLRALAAKAPPEPESAVPGLAEDPTAPLGVGLSALD